MSNVEVMPLCAHAHEFIMNESIMCHFSQNKTQHMLIAKHNIVEFRILFVNEVKVQIDALY